MQKLTKRQYNADIQLWVASSYFYLTLSFKMGKKPFHFFSRNIINMTE